VAVAAAAAGAATAAVQRRNSPTPGRTAALTGGQAGTSAAPQSEQAPHEARLSGAPFMQVSAARSHLGLTPDARVAPPAWEPRALIALARWEPGELRTTAGRVAGYAWAAPLTLVGLVVGAAADVRPLAREGVVVFERAAGLTGKALASRSFSATTLGHVVVARGRLTPARFAHELVHVRQAERLGPLLGPIYLGLLALYGYARHPMERAARHAGRRTRSSSV
jgi:hypothetical protein